MVFESRNNFSHDYFCISMIVSFNSFGASVYYMIHIFFRIINDPDRKSLPTIFVEMLHLWIRNKHLPKYYLTRHLFLRGSGDYRDYLSTREIFKIIYGESIHDEEVVKILSNKILFGFRLHL